MSHPDEFPEDAAIREELRSLVHGQFERLFTEHPDLNQFADRRAETLVAALAEATETDANHPALPTLKSALKKFVFCFTDPGDLDVTPTDEDIATLLMQFYEVSDDNLQITANGLDTYANYMPSYAQETQVALGGQWAQMDGSQRLWSTLELAQERYGEDFQ